MIRQYASLAVGAAGLIAIGLALPSIGAETKGNGEADNFAIEHEIGRRAAVPTGGVAAHRGITFMPVCAPELSGVPCAAWPIAYPRRRSAAAPP